jgi:3-methylcrotonyl-CoA carboxylase alpha subunit
MMFKKILVANRGEIACRIHRTAARLGVRTVAVYSDADRLALHTRTLDEAVHIGPAPARESYLVIEKLIGAAQATGAEAIHPGYGFLSENADFAEAVTQAGLVFIGPPAEAIRAMGSKSAAKDLMAKAKVATVPGYHGADQHDARFVRAAEEIGYPVLIKAAMGGGGKGMRRVDNPADLIANLAAARREALNAFGDQTLLIEKYLKRPRHIEMQIFADPFGNVVHLFERDCSLQRRHQKVVEEAPAPGFTPAARAKLAAAATAAAKAIGYVGAGTVEFIAEADALGDCYFMEMNTRLQVEHPVTEMITGLDLVEWQLRVASGEKLPLTQNEIQLEGHAIEVRLCAEDPARDFLPASGRLLQFEAPAGRGIRLDTGVVAGSEIGIHYDSMLAKLIAYGSDRATAISRLSSALAGMHLAGIVTNIDLVKRLLDHPAFQAGDVETGFIAQRAAELTAPAPVTPRDWALLALGDELLRARTACQAAGASSDPTSPWHAVDSWRIGGQRPNEWHYAPGGSSGGPQGGSPADEDKVVFSVPARGVYLMRLGDARFMANGSLGEDGRLDAEIDGHRLIAWWFADGDWRWLQAEGRRHRIRAIGPFGRPPQRKGEVSTAGGIILAPMPGRIVKVLVEAGAKVSTGQPIFLLEAMKMEHTLAAPQDGVVALMSHRAGDLVAEGAELARIDPAAMG